MNAEGPRISPGYGAAASQVIRGEHETEVRRVNIGGGAREEEENDVRISELFERADLGHPFGYRRDVNLLMDVICDRLSSRLCHRCVRQTCNQTCPRLSESNDSCQCQKTNDTAFNLGRLVQGREEITQTTSHRCESCNAILCDRANTRETALRHQQDLSTRIGPHDILSTSRGGNHPDPESFNNRRIGFLKTKAFLEEKFKQGMVEKARQLSLSNRTFASHNFGNHLPRQPAGSYKTTFNGTPGVARVQTEKPVYIKGTNPFLDQLKYELQNDEDTKHEFAKIYQEDNTYSPLSTLPYETPLEFENRTVGATRHMHASPVDLLRKRISHYSNGPKLAPTGNLESNVPYNKQTKTACKGPSRWTVEEDDVRNDGRSSEELMEVDPSIHHQVVSLIPRATGQKHGRCNALVGFADKMSQEAVAEGPTYKCSSTLWKQTYEKLFAQSSTIPTSTALRSLQKKNTNIKLEKDRASEERGIQAVPSAHVAQTQTIDGSGSSTKETSIGQQRSHRDIGSGMKTITSIEIGNINCGRIHADICTQTSKTSQELIRQQPFSLNMWTQTHNQSSGTKSQRLHIPRKDPGHQPIQTRYSSDWSPVSDSDSEGAFPLNPKNTVKFYKQSFKKLKKKFVGGKDASSSDSDVDTHQRVGRVLGSSRDASTDSWYNMEGSRHHSELREHAKTTHARSFQYAHPVLRDVLCLEKPRRNDPVNIKGVREGEAPMKTQDFFGWYDEYDLAAFFELHHLDVPVSLRKKRGKRDKSDDKRSGQVESGKVTAVLKDDIKQEQTDEKTLKRPNIPQSPPPTMKQKPEFHQGALNQFDAKEGTRRLSWRDQAHVNRKAKFFEVEADIAGETKQSSVDERKMSSAPDTGAVRRISLFEGLAHH